MKTEVEILLGEWGRWKRGENRTGLGYPSSSAFRERVDGERRSEADTPLSGDDVRQLDRLIGMLHPEARAVLAAHYIRIGPAKTKMAALRLGRTAYYGLLDFAHQFLSHQRSIYFQTKVSGHLAQVSG
ncbi:hypothetical protein [Alcaligenes endophyticus]|uniref:Antitermination protein Q n=1 Tax=Alcaligenes endophyticus TaxID=1929088 RepID=A0ABT8EKC1_9BURK|nr:hypothetical protein [Alcaligenes endophyticus]MCX5592038.1 hypothetical protein [Alcaligenes endophyticus]MDN4121728.1 hypothetical protein [Alcaligenes endophyticus]